MSNAALIAIVGPTAAGKSVLAMDIARRLGAEIVNGDAFCLYRGMDIGTAKPSLGDRAAITHHVIDTHDVSAEVDVATYQHLARSAVQNILARDVPVVLAGGSGLYVQAVLDDLQFPATDPAVRARLNQELAERGAQALHARLAVVDPPAARHIQPGNGRRIVRALEVNEVTGQPFTASLGQPSAWLPSVRIGFDPGVAAVDEAIAGRVQAMWEAGLVQEVQRLGPQMSRTARLAVGYRQILEDPQTARERTITATRQLARKQRKWFRRDPRLRWAQTPAQVDQILGSLEV